MSQQTTEPGDAVAAALADAKARRDEYAKFTANQPIDIGGARAFNPGDRVPTSHVTRGLVDKAAVDDAADAPPQVLARPADSASMDKWRAYATQNGMTGEEAAAVDDKAVFVNRYPKVEG